MKVIILAGGHGTRLAEETSLRPKPMVEIGGKPILWHIMNSYAAHGFKDFLVACGYKGEVIKEYFHKIFLHSSDYIVDLQDGSVEALLPTLPATETITLRGLEDMAFEVIRLEFNPEDRMAA